MAYMQPSEHPDKYIKNTDKKPPLTNSPKSFTETVKKGYNEGSKGSMVGKYSRGGQNTDLLGGIMGAGRAAINYFKN